MSNYVLISRTPRKKWTTGWITAISNFSVQYNFQAISTCLLLMSEQQCTTTIEQCRDGKQSTWIGGTAAGTVFAGAVIGQILMGYAGDHIGRNLAMLLTLSIATCGAAFSAIFPSGPPYSVYIMIIAFRFLLGVGLGGVYPLSAAKAAESVITEDTYASSKKAALAFCYQVPGAMTPWLLAYLLSFIPGFSSDTEWRLLLGLGAIPAATVVVLSYIEMKLDNNRTATNGNEINIDTNVREGWSPATVGDHSAVTTDTTTSLPSSDNHHDGITTSIDETELGYSHPPSTRIIVVKNPIATDPSSPSPADVSSNPDPHKTSSELDAHVTNRSVALSSSSVAAVQSNTKRPGKTLTTSVILFKLMYSGGSWFLFDVVYYSVGLYGGEILSHLGPQRGPDESVSSPMGMRSTSLRQAIALSLGLPSCALTIGLLKQMKTKRTQTLGFCFMSVCFVLIASVYESCRVEHPAIFYAVYCLLLFSMAGGPNVTTFVLPAETFPKEIRSTYNGICAACGKLGAVVGVFGFGPLSRITSFPIVMSICALISILGAALSYFCIGLENMDLHHGNTLSSWVSCDLSSNSPEESLFTAEEQEHEIHFNVPMQLPILPVKIKEELSQPKK